MTAFTDYFEDVVLEHLRTGQGTLYLALFTTPTGDDGSGTEAVGGGYARQEITFAAPSGGSMANDVAVTFSAMADTELVEAALFDAPTGGNMLVHAPLVASILPAPGADVTLPVAGVVITVD